jgi:DnaJ family protein B protein 4
MSSHYDTLGVDRNATDAEIKKAYRSMSFKYHPDKNPSPDAAEKIRKINEAYEVLSDSQKKQEYDMHHQFPFNPIFGFGNGMGQNMGGMQFTHMASMDETHDINNIFRMMFAHGMPPGFPGFAMGPDIQVFHNGVPLRFHKQAPQQKPAPIIKHIEISIEQAYTGCTIPVEFERWVYLGEIKNNEYETIYITIPEGVDSGETVIMQDCGNVVNEVCKGDVHLVITVANKTVFKRQGLDLIITKSISLKESLCGFSFDVQHVNGKNLCLNNMNNPVVIKPNYCKVIPGLGMVKDGKTGNIEIHFTVEYPDSLTPEQIRVLSSVL